MDTATAGARHPKGAAKPRKGPPARDFLAALLDTTVGGKILVALTGVGLTGFVVFHMIGNLKLLQGPEAINHYAHFLKHDLGALIWIARGGLLALFVLHLALALRLAVRAAAARPVPYQVYAPAQATPASRTMAYTGAVVGLFVLFHLAHYTFAWVKGAYVPDPVTGGAVYRSYLDLTDAKGRHDVYEMMVAGFRNTPLAAIYLASMLVLFAHLGHGVQSAFQTLGLKNARFRGAIAALGWLVAGAVLVGNVAIVMAVQLGYVKPQYIVG